MGYWFLIGDFLVKGMFDHFLLMLVKDDILCMSALPSSKLPSLFSLRRATTLAGDFFFFFFPL